MNNQAKLRAALLKWREALAPVNYIDRIKQIKKGCKIFKRGLKKEMKDKFLMVYMLQLEKIEKNIYQKK